MKLNLKDNYKTYFEYLDDVAPKIKPYIIESISRARTYFENDKHIDVDKYLYEPILNFSENSGKLHRPLTCIAAYLACVEGDMSDIENVCWIAAAIENFQSAALIHDDIADGGKIRRSVDCMHIKEGVGLAINAGDFGLASVIASVLQNIDSSIYSKDKMLKIIKYLTFMEYMTIEGQAMDLGWARDNRFDIREEDYIVMAVKKSAYYSATVPCVLGAICADADEKIIDAFKIFGKNIGLAFQIKDDILNLTSNSNKDFRNDITEGKRTLLICKALELSSTSDKKILVDILKSGTKDDLELARAVDIIESCGAMDYGWKLSQDLCIIAKQNISSVICDSVWKDLLIDMANWVTDRSY